jgi:hypothetical protein
VSDIGALIIGILADCEIRQASHKEVEKRYGKNTIAGITYENPRKIHLCRTMDHQDKIRCLLHEVAHYYCAYVMHDTDASEHFVEELAAKWHEELYKP